MKIPRDERIKLRNDSLRILIEADAASTKHRVILDAVFEDVPKKIINELLTIIEGIE